MPPRLSHPARRQAPARVQQRRPTTSACPEGQPERLPEYLFARLADLLGKPLMATVAVELWPAVTIRAVLEHVRTVDETAYLCFDQAPQGTRIVVPAEGLRSISQPPDQPTSVRLSYANASIDLQDMSPAARLAKWRHAIDAAAVGDERGREGRLRLLETMMLYEAANTAEPHRSNLERLIDRVAFLLRPYRGDELYPGREDEPELGDVDDFDW